MRVSVRSIVFVMMMALVALGASGCFQEAGTGVQPTSPGGAAAIPPTSTPFIPPTPLASNTPFMIPATPTVETLILPTVDGSGGALVASSPTAAVVAVVPTVTPLTGGELLSPSAMTATAIIVGAAQPTAAPLMVTENVPAPGLIATATPLVLNPQLQGGEMTATAIIVQATATAFAVETMTATASGILMPTATLDPTLVPTFTLTPDPASICTHVVARGDTLYSIAREYEIALDVLNRANGLTNASLIHIGDELTVPGCGAATPQPVLESTTAVDDATTACVQQDYVIQPGDNLYRLSLRFGVSLRTLQNTNNISNIHHVVAGEKLVIPCAE